MDTKAIIIEIDKMIKHATEEKKGRFDRETAEDNGDGYGWGVQIGRLWALKKVRAMLTEKS